MEGFFANIHRKAISGLLVTRLMYKRTVREANDAKTIAVQTWMSWQAHDIRISVISTICAHMVFASVGASKVIDHIREKGSSWKFGKRTLEEIDAVLIPLETKDRCKLSDLSVTLTGRAFISRLLDTSWGSVTDRLKQCNDAVDHLLCIGVYTKEELDFTYGTCCIQKIRDSRCQIPKQNTQRSHELLFTFMNENLRRQQMLQCRCQRLAFLIFVEFGGNKRLHLCLHLRRQQIPRQSWFCWQCQQIVLLDTVQSSWLD